MSDSIRGINNSSLWKAWKAIRKELPKSVMRDVVDYLEFDVNPDKWIHTLLRRISDGTYEPESPSRFTLAKSNGFSRRMTTPYIPDLVLYRAITDHLYAKARRHEHKHAYFERSTLPNLPHAKKRPLCSMWLRLSITWPYESASRRNWRAWVSYDQYRKHLILKRLYPWIVVTDITNYFDSVLFSRVADVLSGIATNSRMIGLLFFLLERFAIRDAFGESPRIGLCVDEFGCSRRLGHMVLFPHDYRIAKRFGADSYVRWMDDQNIGVNSHEQGMEALAYIGESLARLHLTPNAKKSRILSLRDTKQYFHFDLNQRLDIAYTMPSATKRDKVALRKLVKEIWVKAKRCKGEGHWDKIMKRLYHLSSRADSRLLRRYSNQHILHYPLLTERISDYMRCTGSVPDYLEFVESVWKHNDQVYPDVTRALIESLLRLEPSDNERKWLWQLGSAILRGTTDIPTIDQSRTVAPLLILRYGDRRSLKLLRNCVESSKSNDLSRSAGIIFASYGSHEATVLRNAASKLLRNHLSEMVKMIEAIKKYDAVPDRFKRRFDPKYDSVASQSFLDMRTLLTARLLGLNKRKSVRNWLFDKKKSLAGSTKKPISAYDHLLLDRLWPT